MNEQLPLWLREFERYLPVKTLFLVHGNVYDLLSYPVEYPEGVTWEYSPLKRLLHLFLFDRGYRLVAFYDLVDGVTFETPEQREVFSRFYKGKEPKKHQKEQPSEPQEGEPPPESEPKPNRKAFLTDPDEALDAARRAIANPDIPVAMAIDFSSRLTSAPDRLPLTERRLFMKIAKCSTEAASVNIGAGLTTNNIIVLVCDKLNDLPPWLYFDSPFAKSLEIELPGKEERRRYFEMFADRFFIRDRDGSRMSPEESMDTFVDLTHGLKNYELESLRILSRGERPRDLGQIVQVFKYRESENPWDQLVKKIRHAEEQLKVRVKGQDAAVSAVVDIVKRSAVGLSGAQHSRSSQKPRGILFFGGPTGVGKTELAKALAELLFGNEEACIRFDMSEFAQEHAAEKLMGAPPGYVGYEQGGQLTGKVKQNPFSVLLFDEVEKAHPLVLDKFLQILEDGRLTSGQGETVYFSESVIIFTSNIGAYEDVSTAEGTVRRANVTPYSWQCSRCGTIFTCSDEPDACDCGETRFGVVRTPFSVVRERILGAIEEHFKFKLGRPEIFNRIGNNFVVFDYIREDVIGQIVGKVLDSVSDEVRERRRVDLEFDGAVKGFLVTRSSNNVEMGGRGIGNLIETTLINPLGREIFDNDLRDCSLRVTRILENRRDSFTSYSLVLERGRRKTDAHGAFEVVGSPAVHGAPGFPARTDGARSAPGS